MLSIVLNEFKTFRNSFNCKHWKAFGLHGRSQFYRLWEKFQLWNHYGWWRKKEERGMEKGRMAEHYRRDILAQERGKRRTVFHLSFMIKDISPLDHMSTFPWGFWLYFTEIIKWTRLDIESHARLKTSQISCCQFYRKYITQKNAYCDIPEGFSQNNLKEPPRKRVLKWDSLKFIFVKSSYFNPCTDIFLISPKKEKVGQVF